MKFSRKTVLTITAAALVIEAVIISYNHYTGFIKVKSIVEFIIRLFIGTSFASVFGSFIVYMDLMIIRKIEEFLSWEKELAARAASETLATIMTGVLTGVVLTLIADILFPYKEPIVSVMVTNSVICVVINILVITILEAIAFSQRGHEARLKAERLEKENSLIRFETLKNQLNPHFLFNSLNVLSALVGKDTERAQKFIDEFSTIYRYILDVIDRQAVTLKEEIEFAESYLYLQEIRFGCAVRHQIDIDPLMLERLLPPLAVQTLLENALKHNRASADMPLNIRIYSEGDSLFVTNNLQPKLGPVYSKGIGLENLTRRYIFVAGVSPEYQITQNEYIAKLPLLTAQ